MDTSVEDGSTSAGFGGIRQRLGDADVALLVPHVQHVAALMRLEVGGRRLERTPRGAGRVAAASCAAGGIPDGGVGSVAPRRRGLTERPGLGGGLRYHGRRRGCLEGFLRRGRLRVSLAAGTSTPIPFATPSAARSRSCWVLDARLRGSAYAPAACLNLARFSADARTSWESATRASALATALAQASFPSGSGSSRVESSVSPPSASGASRRAVQERNVSLATGSEPDELRLEGGEPATFTRRHYLCLNWAQIR